MTLQRPTSSISEMSSKVIRAAKANKSSFSYHAAMVFFRIITQIFFREVRPRGAFHIPREGPVIFVAAPHNNQACTEFLISSSPSDLLFAQMIDPLLLTLEVYRETHRHVSFLTAAASMRRKWVGFFARMIESSASSELPFPRLS